MCRSHFTPCKDRCLAIYKVIEIVLAVTWIHNLYAHLLCFFFQAEDGIRDLTVTGVQTCALPISCATAALCVPSFLVCATTFISFPKCKRSCWAVMPHCCANWQPNSMLAPRSPN